MAMNKNKTLIKSIVRAPKQDRARVTVEAILEGRADRAPTLAEAMGVFPVEWVRQ